MDKCEMKVDDVTTSLKKDNVKCVLKGDASINGVPVAFKLDLTTDGIDVFEKLGIDQKDSTIDVILKESAQQTFVG